MKKVLSWFKGVQGKLILLAMIPALGFIIVGAISLQGANQINHFLTSSQKEIIPTLQGLSDLREYRNRFGYVGYEAIYEIRNGRDPSDNLAAMKTSLERYKKAIEHYDSTVLMQEEEKAYKPIKDNFPKIITSMEKILSLISSKDAKNLTDAEVLLATEYKALGGNVRRFVVDTVGIYNERIESEGKAAVAAEKSVTFWIWIVTILAIFFSMGLSILVSTRLAKAISSIVARLNTASTSVTQSVEQLNEAGNGLSQSSTEAAASLEETVASLEEMSSMVKHNSDNAKQAAALSSASRDAAEKGQEEIVSLIRAMGDIAQSSKKIEEIISVIDDIAFQTNLLALNASVEAARAGEQGKGFAVVADAVRALAQRSADAAKDINVLIKDSVQKVENGGRIAGQSEQVLNNIVNSVKKVADLNNEISSASAEQTAGISQISKAMNQLDQASQGNAASAEEIAATSGEIANLALTTQKLTVELAEAVHGAVSDNTKIEQSATVRQKKVAPPKATPVAAAAPKKPAKVATQSTSQEVIPFDEDEPRAKVGNTDGF